MISIFAPIKVSSLIGLELTKELTLTGTIEISSNPNSFIAIKIDLCLETFIEPKTIFIFSPSHFL